MTRGRFENLDLLRGLAILFVLFHHLPSPLDTRYGLHWGGRGVDLFFCLSGFLVGLTALDRARPGKPARRALGEFWALRTARIWPLYALLLLVTVVGVPGISRVVVERLRADWPYYVTFVSNYFQQETLELGVLWSLSVEEQFYVLVGATILLSGDSRDSLRAAFRALAVATIAATLVYRLELSSFRLWGVISDDMFVVRYWFASLSRMDALAMGIFAATFREVLRVGTPSSWKTLLALALPIGVFVACVDGVRIRWVPIDHALCALAGATSVLLVSGLPALLPERMPMRRVADLPFAVIRFAGKLSFGLYLFHPYTRSWLRMWGIERWAREAPDPRHAAAYVAVWLVVTFALSWLSFEAFERPVLARVRAIVYPPSASAQST